MEDLVAFRVVNGKGRSYFFITWGRVFDSVDPSSLFKAVRPHLTKFEGIDRVRSLHLCRTLKEASGAPLFYEALFDFAQRPIPFGAKTYPRWRAKVRLRIQQGKDIYGLGPA
jgi:hypothetical protein